MRCSLLAIITGLIFAQTAGGDGVIPPGYIVPPITLSSDYRYGVTVPKLDDEETLQNPQNSVIELKTGRLLGAIQVPYVAFDHINDGEIDATIWSEDDSMLLWQVDGKWGFNTETLVSLRDGKILAQVDILHLLQQEVLRRTKEASPKDYAAVKANSAGFGSWYKDGFAVDCVLVSSVGPLKFPLLYRVFLTSNTKGAEGVTNVDSRMTAEVNRDGTFTVKDFHLGTDPPARTW